MVVETVPAYSSLADSGVHRRRPSWWLPGCSDECREVRAVMLDWLRPTTYVLHDPASHEVYGRRSAETVVPRERVATGPLMVDHERLMVTVDGREVACTPKELQLLLFLSARLGRTCTATEILGACWGPTYICERPAYAGVVPPEAHVLRVTMARLRAKLGPARRMIVTRPGVGYRMVREPAS